MKTKLRSCISAVGCCFVATYLVIVVVVHTATTHPSNIGQDWWDWFPGVILAMPWYALDTRLLLPGFVVNIALLYLLGAMLQRNSRIVAEWEIKLRKNVSTWGCYFAGAYISIVVVVFAVTATTTNPSKMGMDWIPFSILAMPWPRLGARLVFPGFVVNAALWYLLGAVLQKISRIVGEWG